MFKRKGQSTLEYALIIAVIVGGLLLMQHYVRRGFAGRLKGASDDMAEQYDPTDYTGTYTIDQSSKVMQTIDDATRTTRTEHKAPQTSLKTGSEKVEAWKAGEDIFAD